MKQKNCTMFLFAVNWDNPCQYLTILGDTWQYLAIPDNTFTILSNTYQFLTIPDKPGIGWYRLVSPKLQVSPPIRFQYREGIVAIQF